MFVAEIFVERVLIYPADHPYLSNLQHITAYWFDPPDPARVTSGLKQGDRVEIKGDFGYCFWGNSTRCEMIVMRQEDHYVLKVNE